MALVVRFGHSSLTGKRERNEDFVGIVSPTGIELAQKGYLCAVADGVSGADGGREAAEYCVRGLVTDYYATPDTWEPLTALDRVIQHLIAGCFRRHKSVASYAAWRPRLPRSCCAAAVITWRMSAIRVPICYAARR